MVPLRTSRLAALAAVVTIVVVSSLAHAAPWPEYGEDAANTSVSPETWLTTANAPRLLDKWSTQVGEASASTPIAVNDTVYVGTLAGEVLALGLGTGQIYWRAPVDGPVYGTLLYKNGFVFAGDLACNAYCFLSATGQRMWKTSAGDPSFEGFFAAPALTGSRLVLGVSNFTGDAPCNRGRVVAFNTATGAIAWTWYAVNDTSTGGGVWCAPAVEPSNGRVYIANGNPCTGVPGTDTDAIVCLDGRSGSKLWSYQAIPNDGADRDFGSSPCLFDVSNSPPVKGVAAGCKDGALYAINRVQGTLLWRTPLAKGVDLGGDIGILAGPAAAGGLVFVGTGVTLDGHPGSIVAVDGVTGQVRWQHFTTAAVFGSVALINGVVLSAASDGQMLALSQATGDSLWGAQVDNGAIFCGPSISNGNALISTFDYRVHAFALSTATGIAPGSIAAAASPGLRAWRDETQRVRFSAAGRHLPGRVSLFDLTGRYIASVWLAEPSAAGMDGAWDGRRADGAVTAPGVYLARLDGGTAATRVVLPAAAR